MTDPQPYTGHDLEALADMPNYYGWIVDIFRPWLHGHTMEIGTGIGTVAQQILNDVECLDLVEPSDNLKKFLPANLVNDERVSIFTQTLEQRLSEMDADICDAVIMVNVLEHIENDEEALIGLRRVLKTSGHLLLFVPALEALFSDLDRLHGHYRRYHRRQLSELMQKCGFRIKYVRYFDIAGVLPWWLINTIGGKTDFEPKMAKIYDRVAVPLTRTIERLIPPPFGKNLIVIAESMDAENVDTSPSTPLPSKFFVGLALVWGFGLLIAHWRENMWYYSGKIDPFLQLLGLR